MLDKFLLKRAIAVVALYTVVLSANTHAQDNFPDRPIYLVSCCAGVIDAIARVVAEDMSATLKIPVVVETRPGVSGMIGAEHVAKSKPDGYTVFIGTNSTHAANQSLFLRVPYDYVTDFVPINGIAQGPLLMVVPKNSPIHSVSDLTAAAKKSPGKLTFGWASSSTRIAMELYSQMTDVKLMSIPYKTNPQATADLVGGQIDVMFADMSTTVPMVQGGRLRPLAISGDNRAAIVPDVPTVQEAGVPEYKMTWWVAAWAPAGTPKTIVNTLNKAIGHAIKTPKSLEFFKTIAVDPIPMTSEQMMAFQIEEHDKWKQIITSAGIKPQ